MSAGTQRIGLLGFTAAAGTLFHAAFQTHGGWPVLAFPFAVVGLLHFLPSPRFAFYLGLTVGVGLYAPHLTFFWTLFGPAAVLLWMVLAFWIAAFLGVSRALMHRLSSITFIVALPLLWTGFEYFRSELYFLRFSWLTPAMPLARPGATPPLQPAVHFLGTYGVGFALFLAAGVSGFARRTWRLVGLGIVGVLAATPLLWSPANKPSRPVPRTLMFAGAQIESASESEIVPILDRLLEKHPNAELLILPEYSLLGEPDAELRNWCQKRRRHVLVGGRVTLESNRFYNTAFVVDPQGEIIFRQAKSVPIQFFDDGIPAASQRVWNSPWGKIGIAICYDLSYTRVIDRLVRDGAEALIIPTMDAVSWGREQHELHARVAPLRAAEYGLPIARVASSGISQTVDRTGAVTSSAPFSEEILFIEGQLELAGSGRIPMDRWLGPLASGVAALLTLIAALPPSILSFLPFVRPLAPASSPTSAP